MSAASERKHDDRLGWQSRTMSVIERNAHMFLSRSMSDITFVFPTSVEPSDTGHVPVEHLPAHRYVLATASAVFQAMLFGPLAEKSTVAEIVITDIEVDVFAEMLRYIYCDHVYLDGDNVTALLYCAQKYHLPHLAERCVTWMLVHISAENVLDVLQQACMFEMNTLVRASLIFIDLQAEVMLTRPEMLRVDRNLLRLIVERDTLNAKEVDILRLLNRWAQAKCGEENIEATINNKRLMLGDDLLQQVRLPTLTPAELANQVGPFNLLTTRGMCTHSQALIFVLLYFHSKLEINELFLYYLALDKPRLKFPNKKRRDIVPQKCHRFGTTISRIDQWRYRGSCDAIEFSVTRSVFVLGLGLYGPAGGACDYNVAAKLRQNNQDIAEIECKLSADGTSQIYSVYFSRPIVLEPNRYYTASVVITGEQLSYFGQAGCKEVETNSGVVFRFQPSPESTNGTGICGGQIPQILFHALD